MSAAPLTRPEVVQLLRYWLAALRYDDALGARPRARRPSSGPPPPLDVLHPLPGASYFKLPRDADADALLGQRLRTLTLPLDADRAALFSSWLRTVYRLERAAQRGQIEDASGTWLVGFPIVHFPRTDELAPLLRFSVTLEWLDGEGKRFGPPTARARRKGELPLPPTHVRIGLADDEGAEADLLPFTLDTRLAGHTLRIDDETLADYFATLRRTGGGDAEAMMRATRDLLASVAGDDAPPPDEAPHLDALTAALRRLLPPAPGGAGVYPVGIVYDGDQVFATRHLQRELGLLIQHPPGKPPWAADGPLWPYLSGTTAPSGWAPHRGHHTPRGLTPDQLDAAEAFLGSRLTAVQGPPGTGKTTLILDLAAGLLVERAEHLAEHGAMGDATLLVSSTNNRAVDNVLDPLGHAVDGLALGLRLGSQAVTATVTVDALRTAHDWLSAQDPPDARPRFEAALGAFRSARDAHRDALEATWAARRAADGVVALEARLAALPPAAPPDDPTLLKAARRHQKSLGARLERMQRAAEGEGALDALTRLARRMRRGTHKALVGALAALDLTFELAFPPPLPETGGPAAWLEAWQDAIEDAIDRLEDLRDTLQARRQRAEQNAERAGLEAALAAARAEIRAGPRPPTAAAGLGHAVYRAALELRTAWAVVHRAPLLRALAAAAAEAETKRSLRRLLEKGGDHADWLRRLYPVLGCTLLSLGNALPPDPDAVDRLVIDEAGQCHPAYAVSGLLRARRALVIGDVHQLEPVVRLSRGDEVRVRRNAEITLPIEKLQPYQITDEGGSSAQALADRAVERRPILRDHFRCQAPIIEVCDALCGYGLRVRTPPRSLVGRVPALHAPLLFSAVQGEQVRARGSWRNDAELDRVEAVLGTLYLAGVPWREVAVVTPYVGQLDGLRQRLRGRGVPLAADAGDFDLDLAPGEGLVTGTVHRFQGGERSVVIFSTVVTRAASLAFLDGRVNLLNVAISRARDHLVVVGHPHTLRQGSLTRLLVERAEPTR